MAVNLRERTVTVHDPRGLYHGVNNILASLFAFFKQELLHHEGRQIEQTPWREFIYQKARQPRISEAAGLYVLAHARQLCLGDRTEVTSASMAALQQELLRVLDTDKENAVARRCN